MVAKNYEKDACLLFYNLYSTEGRILLFIALEESVLCIAQRSSQTRQKATHFPPQKGCAAAHPE